MKLHYAEVIDNNDLTMKGRVKIKVYHKHDTMTDDMLPWANQFNLSMGGMTLIDSATPYGSVKIPKIGSLVWVFFADEKNDKTPFYVADVTLETFNITKNAFVTAAQIIMNAWVVNPSGITPSTPANYQDLHYTIYPTGMIIAVNITSNEMFVYHSPTTFVTMNNSGGINIVGSDVVVGGNTSVTMGDITLNSIVVDASGINITNGTGTGSVSIDPAGAISVTGLSIEIKNSAGTGSAVIDAAGQVTISGLTVKLEGTTNLVAPDPVNKGGFCALPTCIFSGAPHVGNIWA